MTSGTVKFQSFRPANQQAEGNDGVMKILQILSGTVCTLRGNHEFNGWESCLCMLILTLNPNIRIHEVIEAVPYGGGQMDCVSILNATANLGYESHTVDTTLGRI